jgi:ABC-type transport system involved in multi-copper enzyme maturation permease subunit
VAGAVATATFDSVALQGNWAGGHWIGAAVGIGDDVRTADLVGVAESAGSFTVSGSGDIAPATGGVGTAPERVLIGAFGPTMVVMVLAVLFITTEYRRGLIRTTLSATPRRGRVLAAKALVICTAGFVVTLVAAAIATVTTLVLLPFVLATAAVLPAGPSDWLLRVTPAAAFAMHQTSVVYPQVNGAYTPAFGYYPLGPWGGFAVLCGYAALAMAIAVVLLRRRDV